MSPPTRPFDTEQFLDNAASLRRLARGLLFDRSRADDVVQDAWLATLEAQCPDGYTPRSWLAGWVRNRVRQTHREDRRRRRREQVASRPEREGPEDSTESSPDAALERLETLRLVVDAVRDLKEPYRSTLLMRFFDDLSPRDIARRRGVPVNTVRTHLRRGLEQVRQRLDTDCQGGREALLGVLVPLAGPAPAGSALTVSAATQWTGALLMNTKAGLAGLTAVVLALSIATFLWLDDESWDSMEPSESSAAAADDLSVPSESAPSGGEVATPLAEHSATTKRVAADSERAAAPGWVVAGTASNASGPYPGVQVRLRRFLGSEASGEPELETVVTSDARGRFSWEIHAPTGTATVTAAGVEEDHVSWAEVATVLPGDPVPELDVRLYPMDSTITGFVRDEDGDPIAGARIWAYDETTSRDDGAYAIGFPSGHSTVYLQANAEGYSQARVVVEPRSGGPNEQADFVLRREFAVHGRVLDENGSPVEGASVTSFYTNDNTATSGPDGRYRLGSLDPGRPEHSVTARKTGYVLCTVKVETGANRELEQDLVLTRGVEVSGTVVDAGGAPVPDAELYIGFSPNAYDRIDAVADASGRFVFPAVRRGSQTLVTSHQHLATDTRQIEVPAEGEILAGLEIALVEGSFIAGRVVDDEGLPLTDVGISARHHGEYIDRRTSPDSDGRFRFDNLPTSDVSLEVFGRGLVRLEQDIEVLNRDDVELVVRRAGVVAGTVIDGETGERLPTFRIRFVYPDLQPGDQMAGGYSASWVREGHLFTDTDGTWTSEGDELPPGTVLGIEASADGYGPSVKKRVLVEARATPESLVIELFPDVRVTGIVVAADTGSPLEGVMVKHFTRDHPLREDDSDDTHGRTQARTDRSGNFELQGIAAGEMFLAAEHPEYGLVVDGPFVIEQGEREVERTIEVTASGRITGRLLSALGEPLSGERVTVRAVELASVGSEASSVATTDRDGRFSFGPLQQGTWELTHEWGKDDWRLRLRHFQQRVELESGETLDVELRPTGTASIAGTVTGAEELNAVLKATILSIPDPEASSEPRTARSYGVLVRDGQFEISGIEPGRYAVMISHWANGASWDARVDVTLSRESQTEVTLELEKQER